MEPINTSSYSLTGESMDKDKKDKIQKMISHPLEEFFDIEENTTEIVRYERKTEITKHVEYDDKDAELEETYQEIIDSAMSGFDNLRDMAYTADTKFAARLAEVGAQYLNAALAAASKKTQLKENKDKLVLRQRTGPAAKNTTNNILLLDRNEALKMALEAMAKPEDTIDAEVIEVTKEEPKE